MRPIHEILRHTNLGSLETKRQNLRRALDQYLMEFNACRCGPCFNNGEPILEGTSCKCQCPVGRQGLACEQVQSEGKATHPHSASSLLQLRGFLEFTASLLCALLPTTLGTRILSSVADLLPLPVLMLSPCRRDPLSDENSFRPRRIWTTGLISGGMYSFPKAAIAKYQKLGGLLAMEIYCLRLLEIRNPILGILARLLSSGGSLGGMCSFS